MNRWPLSPQRILASRDAQEVKYAHHGPTPDPAVAWRYWAMRGESLEPGGCSATPTSWLTRLTIAWPADEAGGCAAVVPVSVAAPAFCSAVENVVDDGVEGVVATGAAAAGTAKSDCS